MTEHYPFVNTPLPYAYDALEPYIDTQTMHLHHDRHLQSYVDHLNDALKEHPNLQTLSLEQLICKADQFSCAVGTPISRNAGGVYNHRFYFDSMCTVAGRTPVGKLADAINKTYGSFEIFLQQFKEAALSVFGSGYAWLVVDRCGSLRIMTTANQQTPLTVNLCPVINVDVWEHAYYLKHYNERGAYFDDWANIADWLGAGEKYLACRRKCRP